MQSQIMKLLKKEELLSINELSSKLKVERHTASKYLNKLEGAGKITHETKGRAKLYKLVDNDFIEFMKKDDEVTNTIKNILKEVDNHVSIQTKDFDVIWNNKLTNSKNKKCYELYANRDSVCPNCPAGDVISSGNEKKSIVNMQDKLEVDIKPLKNNKGETIAIIEIAKSV